MEQIGRDDNPVEDQTQLTLAQVDENGSAEKAHRPMLLVCYTNHALDSFLEGITKFCPEGLIRIGGRCKNPAIEKYEY
jgi:hypothetical protein